MTPPPYRPLDRRPVTRQTRIALALVVLAAAIGLVVACWRLAR